MYVAKVRTFEVAVRWSASYGIQFSDWSICPTTYGIEFCPTSDWSITLLAATLFVPFLDFMPL